MRLQLEQILVMSFKLNLLLIELIQLTNALVEGEIIRSQSVVVDHYVKKGTQ